MIISQKRKCIGCKASRPMGNGKCSLGYKIREDRPLFASQHHGLCFPLEPCPKPLTNSDYVFAWEVYRKR